MAKFWACIRFLAVAGVGLFGDGWLNITIGLVVPMIGYLYYKDEKHTVPTIQADTIKAGFSLGMITGQLLFGVCGDALGRHKIYGKELILTIIGTLMVICMPVPGQISHEGLVAWLFVFRFVTGMGTGGDYPMTGSVTAEKGLIKSRSRLIVSVFSFIGLGSFSAAVAFVVLLAAFKPTLTHGNLHNLQWVWRLLLGLGLVPLICTLYARLTMKESEPYEEYVSKGQETGLRGKNKRGLGNQFADFKEYFKQPKHALTLVAVSLAWFLFDIAFYGVNLNQSIVLTKIGYGKGATPFETLWKIAVGNVIVSCAGYLPGFYAGIFLPDLMGRKNQQIILSAIVAVLYAIWAGFSDKTSTAGLITLFTLSQFFLNAGPNTTTFLLPAEVFPTRVRGTAHGIAAASGKAGAVITAFTFGSFVDRAGLPAVLGFLSGIMFLVVAVSFLIPEPKGKSIPDIEAGALYKNYVPSTVPASDKSSAERSPSDSTTAVPHTDKSGADEMIKERESV